MNVVIDTDVVAAILLMEPKTSDEAFHLFGRGWSLAAPAHWKAELGNVIWKAVRTNRIQDAQVDEILSVADLLPIASVDVAELWRGAVTRSIAADHPVYDTLFVELGVRLDALVASYDRQLREKFPEQVRQPSELVAGSRRR
jgi:predicted nucleic acid-binding protein